MAWSCKAFCNLPWNRHELLLISTHLIWMKCQICQTLKIGIYKIVPKRFIFLGLILSHTTFLLYWPCNKISWSVIRFVYTSQKRPEHPQVEHFALLKVIILFQRFAEDKHSSLFSTHHQRWQKIFYNIDLWKLMKNGKKIL